MKLSLVTETFSPEINGVAMTLERLVTQLSVDGHEVCVCRPRQSGAAEARVRGTRPFIEEIFPGMPIVCYPDMRIGFPAGKRFMKLWRNSRPDVVHVATEGPLGRSAVNAAKNLGIPIVTTFHTNFQDYLEHYRLGFLKSSCIRYLRSMHNRALCNMVPDPSLMEYLREHGFRSVSQLGRGVDTELFSPLRRDRKLRAEWGADDEDPVFIHVSRVAKEKNIPFVLDTFRKINRSHPRAKCVVVGDGPLLGKLKKHYKECIFAGMRYGEDLGRHYASGDVFLFGSTTETFGNVITEGMASGLVVLSYDYAAAKQYLVDGVNGFSVEAFDKDAFVEKAMAISNQWAELSLMRRAARATAEGLPWHHVVEKYLETIARYGVVTSATSQPVSPFVRGS